ncbi:MAG: pantoate--beta-alanine ligase, partial [Acidobacteria bacterium]|nr:pantoate--beta-alanine ligase [Acidobacteriota bacterium]
TKLFNLVRPRRAYFGQKDAQQCAVVRRMVADLGFDVEVVVCPTVREADGLAMSSRNARLTDEQRAAAPVVFRSLQAAQAAIGAGERDAEAVRNAMRSTLEAEPLARIDYVSTAHPSTLAELDRVDGPVLLSLAVFFGSIRLIDNLPVDPGS